MGKENLERLPSEKLSTAPEVISKLLKKHPEIVQVSIASYPPRPHGEKSQENFREFFLVSELNNLKISKNGFELEKISPLAFDSFIGVSAVGSIVDVCPIKNCDHKTWRHFQGDTFLWWFDHDHGYKIPQGYQKSFIFLDIEMKEPEVLGVTARVLRDFKEDWYVLHSGGGFHVILDKLVDLRDLPKEYGRIITLFGDKIGNQRLKNWGENLEGIGSSWQKVLQWGELVRERIGHIDEPVHEQEKEVHVIDLRHVAVSLKKTKEYLDWLEEESYKPGYGYYRSNPEKIGGFYLRISPKPGRDYPFLVAQKENGKIHFFRTVNDLLKSQKQQRLF